MKKLICAFMVLVCLCSCNKNEIRPHLLGISFAAELMYFNEVYSFDGEILNDGTLIAVMKEPKELEELKLERDRIDEKIAELRELLGRIEI